MNMDAFFPHEEEEHNDNVKAPLYFNNSYFKYAFS